MKKILYVGYARHKRLINGSLVSPMIDSLILSQDPQHTTTSITLGSVEGVELVPSRFVPDRIPPLKFFSAQLKAGLLRSTDLKFVLNLFRPNQHPDLIHPIPRSKWWLFAIRTYFVARYYSVLFEDEAAAHDEARVLVYYGARMLGVIMAFRKLGKQVLDIQHGYIGESHNAYNRSDICFTGSLLEPTGYILWSRDFHIRAPAIRAKPAIYSQYIHLRSFLPPTQRQTTRPKILVATQWGTPLPPYLADVIKSFPTILWVIRLHPQESSNREDLVPLFLMDNVLEADQGVSLAEDLIDSIGHITVNSSTVHEAAALGIRSLFTDPIGIERFRYEIERDLACLVDSESLGAEVERILRLTNIQDPSVYVKEGA